MAGDISSMSARVAGAGWLLALGFRTPQNVKYIREKVSLVFKKRKGKLAHDGQAHF